MASEEKQQSSEIDLASIRKRIDEVDCRIQELISERARYAQQVGISKGELATAVDYYRPERKGPLFLARTARRTSASRSGR